jgi:pyruvate dehydrogenase E2 component (dihydrolipoamide acetyltransferase)
MDIRLPSLGEGADSGTVVNIMVKEGDQIKKDQPILELETEKAVGTIPASAAGTVQKIRVKVGDKISAGQVILSVADGGAGVAAAVPAAQPGSRTTTAPVAPTPREGTRPTTPAGVPPPASPTVRKMAAQLGIDLARVKGTEHGGRVTVEDLRGYVAWLQQRAFAEQVAPAAAKKPVAERVDFSQWGPILKKPVSSLRKTIARRMGESWSSVPRVTQFDEADITGLNELRKKFAPDYEKQGAKLTLTVFAIKAAVAALKKHPLFNASLDEVAGEIILKEYIHIGIAVDTEHGLMVPVIRDADKKTMLQLAKELDDLAGKTRDRKLSADQMRGGSFTISNQGGIGSGHFTPIVNVPEAAILGLGRGALKPVVTKDGKIEARLMLPVTVSYDHRVIDGGSAARFVVDLVGAFQNFSEGDVRI